MDGLQFKVASERRTDASCRMYVCKPSTVLGVVVSSLLPPFQNSMHRSLCIDLLQKRIYLENKLAPCQFLRLGLVHVESRRLWYTHAPENHQFHDLEWVLKEVP